MLNRPSQSLINLTYLVYGLHLFSAFNGLISPALVVTAFLTGWPSIIAVIINYVKRGDARGTLLESHFSWQIRTFWYTALWLVIAGLMFITVILIPIAWLMLLFIGIWVFYRMIRGLLALMAGEYMPMP